MGSRARRPFPAKLAGALFAAGLILSHPRCAHAYFDPGTGSYVLQAVVAGLLGLLLTLKSTWRAAANAIARLLGRRGKGKDDR